MQRCLRDPTFNRASRTPTCDGQTDRRTDRRTHDDSIYRASVASHGKKCWAVAFISCRFRRRCRYWHRCTLYAGIQGHAMYMDPRGDTEANYTVLAMYTDHSVNQTDIERRRTMRPVGDFRTVNLTSPVGRAALFSSQQSPYDALTNEDEPVIYLARSDGPLCFCYVTFYL